MKKLIIVLGITLFSVFVLIHNTSGNTCRSPEISENDSISAVSYVGSEENGCFKVLVILTNNKNGWAICYDVVVVCKKDRLTYTDVKYLNESTSPKNNLYNYVKNNLGARSVFEKELNILNSKLFKQP